MMMNRLKDIVMSKYGTEIALRKFKKHFKTVRVAFTLGSEMCKIFAFTHRALRANDSYNTAMLVMHLRNTDLWQSCLMKDILNEYVVLNEFFTQVNYWILWESPMKSRRAYFRAYLCDAFTTSMPSNIHSADAYWMVFYDKHIVYLLHFMNMLCRQTNISNGVSLEHNCEMDPHSIDTDLDEYPYRLVIKKESRSVIDAVTVMLNWLYGDRDVIFSSKDRDLHQYYMISCRYHTSLKQESTS